MSIAKRTEAMAENVEGIVQENVGKITGNPEDQAEGQAKQAKAKVKHTVENAKDDLKSAID